MNGTQLEKAGLDTPIEQQIRRYYPDYPDSTVKQMMSDPEIVLLSILVDELGSRSAITESSGSARETARYYADEYTVKTDGPRKNGEEPDNVDGKRIDLGFQVDTWDLRFTDDIVVAWKSPNRTHREVKYREEDSPVVGKQAQSRYLWIWRADSATTDPTVFVEGDVDGQ